MARSRRAGFARSRGRRKRLRLARDVQAATWIMSLELVLEGTVSAPEPEAPRRRVVLVGNPNVGKSALFGALTGAYATVSNHPGTTVELRTGRLALAGGPADLVDTPGVLSLLSLAEDERVTRDLLLAGDTAAVVVVGDAKNLARTLSLALQVAELELPFVLCLNMMDEAAAAGRDIDVSALEHRLDVPICPTVAVRREGVEALRDALARARQAAARAVYPQPVERAVRAVQPLLRGSRIAPRALALMALAGDGVGPALMAEPATAGATLRAIRDGAEAELGTTLAYAIGIARHQAAVSLLASVSSGGEAHAPPSPLRDCLERLATHPRLGYLPLLLALAATYQFVAGFGAGTLVELLEERLFGEVLNPRAVALVSAVSPWAWARDMLVGPYGLITMALTYSLALVLPIVGTFFIALGVLEDSGYLPRLAVMADRAFRAMGLNGKAVLPMVLGLGCDTMATLTTRVLETSKERLIVILLLALGVPCSAQLAVTLALLRPLGPPALLIWAGVVVAVIAGVGRLAALMLPGERSDFVFELPPLRLPRPGNILVKTLARVEWYLKEAVPLFALGTLLLFLADRLALLGGIQYLAAPLVTGALGLPGETAEAFVVGFLRRDFGAAGLYRLAEAGALSPAQILVAVVTMTLFIPCIANFFMIVRERGWLTGLAVAAFVFPFAFAVGAALNAALRTFPLVLS
jgi:ferrous iron transport protein B